MRKSQATEEATNAARADDGQDLCGLGPPGALPQAPRAGRASTTAHHGEILQGAVEGEDGSLCHGLVTLRCRILSSEATFEPGGGAVAGTPGWKVKALRAAELTLERYGLKGRGGRLDIRSNIRPCWGLGSSTSDVTAAIRAVGDAYCLDIPAETVAALAVEAEVASDSTMFGDRAMLFAFRGGYVIEDFGGRLPPLDVLGFNTDLTGSGVDTLSHPLARYTREEVAALRPLVEQLRHAVRAQDARLVGEVASASARINQSHLPKRNYDYLERLVERVGALGLQVAHSGTIAGLLFDPRSPAVGAQVEEARALLSEVGIVSVWRFQTSDG
jgi:uncharacterized protein involved in propanediol utilization